VDPRVREYATLLVDRSIDVQAGWQVVVFANVSARPLVEEVARAIGRRGAYAVLRVELGDWRFPVSLAWASEAPDELVESLAPSERHAFGTADAWMTLHAPANTRGGAELGAHRIGLVRKALEPFAARTLTLEMPFVACQFPTPALAQDAEMSTAEFEDFLYGACLLDWEAERTKMERIAERFTAADEVRIVGHETDVTLSLAGREGYIDDGHLNLPGGEVFFAPVEDSAEGVVTYAEFPAVYGSNESVGVRLRFEGGRVVDASARSGEDFLFTTLDIDEGARRIGELGIGCNPGIRRHTKSTLFDEKMYGTVHLAVGSSYAFTGGTNVSAIHWDMVKDLRHGGRILCDGDVVQEDGEWLF
jgi:aminopeptidase